MSDKQKESRRISVEDLPQAEEELTSEEAQEVKGGLTPEKVEASSENVRRVS